MTRTTLLGCALAGVISLSGATALAQEPMNQTTYFTFSAPFELPGGKTLPAGKYTFRVMDSPSNRHIIQILNEDRTQLLATILAIPAERMEPPEDPEVRFMEAAANMPPAIRTWWYPGRTIGHEFIYPKEQARRLAAREKEGVLTVSGDETSVEDMQSADLARITAAGQETTVTADATAETTTAESTTTETTTTTTATPAPSSQAPAPTAEQPQQAAAQPEPAPAVDRTPVEPARVREPETRTALPRTATVLPLIGLVGLASLAGAAVIRRRRR